MHLRIVGQYDYDHLLKGRDDMRIQRAIYPRCAHTLHVGSVCLEPIQLGIEILQDGRAVSLRELALAPMEWRAVTLRTKQNSIALFDGEKDFFVRLMARSALKDADCGGPVHVLVDYDPPEVA